MEALDSLEITVLAEDSVLYESPFLGQHGVSFLLEAKRGNIKRNFLVDVGQNSDALLKNMEAMGISASIIDGIILTHCHYDHTQGLTNVIKAIGKDNLPIITHPDIFRLNFVVSPYLRHVGVMAGDRKSDIEAAGGMLFLAKTPLELMSGLTTTGEVERVTDFEEVGINLKTIEDGVIKDDPMLDDISVIANVKEKGLVVITGCSHAGIVNIVKHSIKLTGINKIEGIIGGFHLIEASDERIKKTVEELSKIDINWISAGHCTGFRAQVELYLKFSDKFKPLHTGIKFSI